MKKLTVLLSLIFISGILFSQGEYGESVKSTETSATSAPSQKTKERHKFDIGFGVGLDYGGLIGTKVSFVPLKHLAIFVSGGYHVVAFGWQAGIIGYFLPKTTSKKFRPYGKFMYGSNRAIIVKGDSKLDKNYLGPTIGVGLEMRFGRSASHGINIDLNFPISSQEFKDDLQFLKDSPRYEVTDPLPIAISIGYHFEIQGVVVLRSTVFNT